MSDLYRQNCDRFESMIVEWFEADGLRADDRAELTQHLATCSSCRESFELSARMEAALVSRRHDVPALDGFLPALAPAYPVVESPRHAHPTLLAMFRSIMSPAGISIILVVWGALLALRFRHAIGEVFVWTSTDRFSALSHDVSNLLLGVARGDAYTLIGIYVALAVVVLGSTGAITLRYIRHN